MTAVPNLVNQVALGPVRTHHGRVRATGGRRTAAALAHAVLARRQPVPATGLPMTWATALERFAGSVRRYIDRVEGIPERALRRRLHEAGDVLERSLVTARAAGADGGGAHPVRDLLRAGTLASRATEAAMAAAAARRAGDTEAAATATATAAALAERVSRLVSNLGAEGHGT